MSIIRADSIKNRAGNGAPDFPNGITVTGVVTATTINANVTGDLSVTGDVGIAGTLTYEDVTNIDSVGIVTARSGIRVTSTTAGIAVGTNAMVSGRADNVLHLHKASGGTADGPTIYFTNQQTGVTANDGLTIGLNDSQSPYFWNRENTATRFATNNAERLRIGSAGQLGIGGANYGSSGQVLTSQGASSAIQWATISTPLVAYKAKESLYTRYSFNNNSWAEIKTDFRISHTPAATGNTIIMHTQIYHTVENSSYGGFANVTDQGTGSDEAMLGESNTSSGVAKGSILGSTYHNEMIRNTNGGNMWMGSHMWGYHITENTNAHTFKLFGRMGSGTRYVGDNQPGQFMEIWEYTGNVMQ